MNFQRLNHDSGRLKDKTGRFTASPCNGKKRKLLYFSEIKIIVRIIVSKNKIRMSIV